MNSIGLQGARVSSKIWTPYRLTRFWRIVLFITAPILAIGGALAAVNWPFRYAKIHPLLEDMFGNQVKIGRYHRTYLPHPGFIATNISLSRKTSSDHSPLGTMQTLSVIGNWSDILLLRDRLRLVEITGFHLLIPAPGSGDRSSESSSKNSSGGSSGGNSGGNQFEGPSTAIEDLRIHNSILDIPRANNGHYRFAIRELDITGMQKGAQWPFSVDMENAMPGGHIVAKGTFGPMKNGDLGVTPVSGQFTFNEVRLSDIGNLKGTLASSGRFKGSLQSIQAEAISDTPDFAVNNGLPTHVRGYIQCTVNGLNGDVVMPRIEVSSGRTVIHAHGEVTGSPKLTNLDIDVSDGRADEILHPFVHDQVPILGPASLHSHAFVAASGPPFLQRLLVKGQFTAPASKATDVKTENELSGFSRRQKENDKDSKDDTDPPPAGDVLSSITGPAEIRNGVVSTSGLVFKVPGATANLHGTFAFHGQVAHLTGTLKTDAGLSHVTTGWKSLFLKALQPFFQRKDHSGSEIPIAVVGRPGHYEVKQDIGHNK